MTRYKKIKLKDGTTMDEHRYIMEQAIGRKLDRYEVVHHKNHNPRDNRIENLTIMMLSSHSRIHNLGKPSVNKIICPEGTKWCWDCKKFLPLENFCKYSLRVKKTKQCRACNLIYKTKWKERRIKK